VVTPTATNVNFTASRFLAGYVRTPAGAGLSQVAVTLTFPGGSNLVTQTGTSGYYYLAGLPGTNCTITPARAGYGFIPPTRDVVPSATNADFTAIKYITGFVLDTAGVGVGNATVSITNSAGSNVVVTTEATGYFYSGALADGQYTVTPSLAGFAFSPASLEVAPTVTNATFSAIRVTTPVFGLSFGAYLPGQSPATGSVVTAEQMRKRLSAIAPFTKWVRSYALDSGMENIGPIAHELGLKTAIGAWLSGDAAANDTQMSALIAAAKAGYVDMAIVGSETLYRRDISEDALIGYIQAFRAEVPAVPVTTAEPNTELRWRSNLVAACDVLLVNIYPYWAGEDVANAIVNFNGAFQQFVDLQGTKPVYISETGWPSAGETVGSAVPSQTNAARYTVDFVSWAESGVSCAGYFYFEAFDEAWKRQAEGERGAHWGMWDENGVLKPDMYKVFEGWRSTTNAGGPFKFEVTSVPPSGSSERMVVGNALGVTPADYRVAVYIQVRGGWWTKPYWSAPLTAINFDGRWSCDAITGGVDNEFTQVAAYLVPANYSPPAAGGGGLPRTELLAHALDEAFAVRQ
jgi:exo-beta-1,3-glucanase (GH17 family)